MGISVVAITWFYVWLGIQPSSAFRIALGPPYIVLVNIMICRVFRNTKLGLYSKAPPDLPSSRGSNLQTHNALNGLISSNSRDIIPIQISVNQVVEHKSDYRPLRPAEFLDFGMV
jgi:hypothetical protein